MGGGQRWRDEAQSFRELAAFAEHQSLVLTMLSDLQLPVTPVSQDPTPLLLAFIGSTHDIYTGKTPIHIK